MIKTIEDVTAFFWYVRRKGIEVRPDKRFADYYTNEGELVFTPAECDFFDYQMNDSHQVCENEGFNIYNIAKICNNSF